jgi:small subunit ribosomal protein S15
MITIEQKKTIIADNKQSENDTASPEVQVSLIHHRINDLNVHFSTNKKDHQSKRGLLILVSQRKKLLDYLKNKNIERYRTLIKKLGLRK